MTATTKRFIVTCCDWVRYEITVDAVDELDAQTNAHDVWQTSGAFAFRELSGSTDDFCATPAREP